MRFDAGMRTPSKASSAVGLPRSPILCSSRATLNPSAGTSTTNAVRRRCLGTSGSVTAKTVMRSATEPWLMNRLEPLSTYSSPSRTARVRAAAASEPASASVSANAIRCSPLASFGQPAGLLLGRAAMDDRQRRQLLDREDEPGRGARAAELLDDEAHAQEVAAEPAVLDRERQGQDVLLREQVLEVPRELGRAVDLGGPGSDLLVGEDPHRVAQVALRVREAVGGAGLGRHGHRGHRTGRGASAAGRMSGAPARERAVRCGPVRLAARRDPDYALAEARDGVSAPDRGRRWT